MARHLVKGARCVGHDPAMTSCFLLWLFDRFGEIFVIPGIDVAGTSDVGRVGKQFFQFGDQRPIGARFETGGQDRGQLEVFGQIAQANTLFLNLSGSMSRTSDNRPAW